MVLVKWRCDVMKWGKGSVIHEIVRGVTWAANQLPFKWSTILSLN